ncbi:hypothetical protein EJ04DRAFT_576689 [Polyplosphaeria fusca]|uniref:F-box domain-containing protein n=1 Tax=Polyplosphaeria fusca TaxID=682080 RepID=A0A9P4QVK7_9PLEO|nr:hypothetical protein EJ04DRAFT_576689 [Polyplosphaeria fusca]
MSGIGGSALADVPNELLAHIAEYLPWEDIPSLMRTCRSYYQIAKPYLYKPYFSSEKGDPEKLLRTIVRDPELGKHIVEIEWTYPDSPPRKPWKIWKGDEFSRRSKLLRKLPRDEDGHFKLNKPAPLPASYYGGERALSRQELADMASHLGKLAVPPEHAEPLNKIKQAVVGKRYDNPEWLAALLMYTPNIERLTIKDVLPNIQERVWMDLVRYKVPMCTHSFSKLTAVTISVGGMDMTHLAPFFEMPSMRRLVVTDLLYFKSMLDQAITKDSMLKNLARRSSSIEHLALRHCQLDDDFVCWLIGLCRALKSFHYQWNEQKFYAQRYLRGPAHLDQYVHYVKLNSIDYERVTSALQPHADTLVELRLYAHGYSPRPTHVQVFTFLDRFPKLAIAHLQFCEDKNGNLRFCLPDSIEVLLLGLHWLTADRLDAVASALHTLAEIVANFPELRLVVLCADMDYSPRPWCEELQKVFHDVGKTFLVQDWGDLRPVWNAGLSFEELVEKRALMQDEVA